MTADQHESRSNPRLLDFGAASHSKRRVVVTGPVGVDKKPFLEQLRKLVVANGHSARVFHVGDLMYAEAPDVVPGRILDLPLARLHSLRRMVFKEILSHVDETDAVIVNTHAAFRWRHGLFPAFDHDLMLRLDADLYITLIDNADAVHARLVRDHGIEHTLTDVLVWREEEILATEVLANAARGHGVLYLVSRNGGENALNSLYRLIFEPSTKKVYPSFPMTHVVDLPEVVGEIDSFRNSIAQHFIAFDPADIDEKRLVLLASEASARGESSVEIETDVAKLRYNVDEIFRIARNIDAQIYARDFKLIDQSDMIVSFIPELPGGKPALSSGVERELQHAHEVTKEVYVIWRPKNEPSPFITATASRIFSSVEEAFEFFEKAGYLKTALHPAGPTGISACRST